MDYKIELKNKNQYATSKWSGGTTTQLMIFPEGSNYADKNFLWRISSATVDADESIFTKLPGISRILMVLKGSLQIKHKNHHSAILNLYEQDSFSGDYETASYGRATDFNLMYNSTCSGYMAHIKLDNLIEEKLIILPDDNFENHTEIFYCADSSCEIQCNSKLYFLNHGDLLSITLFKNSPELNISIKTSVKTAHLVKTVINY